jgi:hypothetical protein
MKVLAAPSTLKMEGAHSSEGSFLFTNMHGVTSLRTVIWIQHYFGVLENLNKNAV